MKITLTRKEMMAIVNFYKGINIDGLNMEEVLKTLEKEANFGIYKINPLKDEWVFEINPDFTVDAIDLYGVYLPPIITNIKSSIELIMKFGDKMESIAEKYVKLPEENESENNSEESTDSTETSEETDNSESSDSDNFSSLDEPNQYES